MDGTLTLPVLKFAEMKRRLGLSPNQDILPTVQGFPPDRQAQAMAIIEEMEEEGIRRMQVRVCLMWVRNTSYAGKGMSYVGKGCALNR